MIRPTDWLVLAFSWQDLAAGGLAVLSALFLTWTAVRAWRGVKSGGCGSGCGSCSSQETKAGFVGLESLRRPGDIPETN